MLRTLSMNRLVVLVVLAGFALDQLTKYLVVRNLPLRSSWPDEGFFRITHVGNTGSAFGLFHNQNLPPHRRLVPGARRALLLLPLSPQPWVARPTQSRAHGGGRHRQLDRPARPRPRYRFHRHWALVDFQPGRCLDCVRARGSRGQHVGGPLPRTRNVGRRRRSACRGCAPGASG